MICNFVTTLADIMMRQNENPAKKVYDGSSVVSECDIHECCNLQFVACNERA